MQKKEAEFVSVTCEPSSADRALKFEADFVDTSMVVKGRMDGCLLASTVLLNSEKMHKTLFSRQVSDSRLFVSLKRLWVAKSTKIFQPADSRFFPPLLDPFTGSYYSDQNQVTQQMDRHLMKEVIEESLDTKSVVDTSCRSAGSFGGYRRDQ